MSEDIEVSESSGIEEEARLLGWSPKEEFRGAEEHWVSAEDFVERGRTILPIVKKNNEELKRKLIALEQKDRERDKTISEWKAYMQDSQAREVATLTSEIHDLREQKKRAISDGDGDAVLVIDDAIDIIKEKQQALKTQPVQQDTSKQNEIFSEWVGENNWYGEDIDKTAYANGIGPILQKQFPMLQGKQFLDMVASKVSEKFTKASSNPSMVESGGTPTASRGKKSYNQLPQEAKAIHDKFVKQGLMTSDEYLKSYDWS